MSSITVADLRPGMRVRICRQHEMLEPEWHLDASSGGKFYVNHGKHRVVPIDLLGEIYIVELTHSNGDTFWGYQLETEHDGSLSRTKSRLLYDTLVAEILGTLPVGPQCTCGKDISGSIGRHSYWCDLA